MPSSISPRAKRHFERSSRRGADRPATRMATPAWPAHCSHSPAAAACSASSAAPLASSSSSTSGESAPLPAALKPARAPSQSADRDLILASCRCAPSKLGSSASTLLKSSVALLVLPSDRYVAPRLNRLR